VEKAHNEPHMIPDIDKKLEDKTSYLYQLYKKLELLSP